MQPKCTDVNPRIPRFTLTTCNAKVIKIGFLLLHFVAQKEKIAELRIFAQKRQLRLSNWYPILQSPAQCPPVPNISSTCPNNVHGLRPHAPPPSQNVTRNFLQFTPLTNPQAFENSMTHIWKSSSNSFLWKPKTWTRNWHFKKISMVKVTVHEQLLGSFGFAYTNYEFSAYITREWIGFPVSWELALLIFYSSPCSRTSKDMDRTLTLPNT
jgi:hypothetical protein